MQDRDYVEITVNEFRRVSKSHNDKLLTLSNWEAVFFDVSVYPNGTDEETEGWVVIVMTLNLIGGRKLDASYPGIVSVIDSKGNSTFPRSFEINSARDNRSAKYLQRSVILNRADEFLPKGVLTLRFDFLIDFNVFSPVDEMSYFLFKPMSFALKNIKETSIPNDISIKVYDLTHQILTLPQFHESRKRFGVYGIPPTPFSKSSDSKKDTKDTLEHVWMFDIEYCRFLLSLHDGIGARLLEASPFIRRCIDTEMRERWQKRIEFPEEKSNTFVSVLYFLEKGRLSPKLRKLKDIYKFSHLFEMENLLRKCAEEIVNSLEYRADFEEVEGIADLYADEYLSELLESRKKECENVEQNRLRGDDDRPNFDCYV